MKTKLDAEVTIVQHPPKAQPLSKVEVGDIPSHPMCRIFPQMSKEEFVGLKESIAAHGVMEPIMVTADGKWLLDGFHRLAACRQLNIVPRVTVFPSDKPDDIASFVLARNLHRRHLDPSQRATIIAAVMAARDRAMGRYESKSKAAREIAEQASVSLSTAKAAVTVAREQPDRVEHVVSGKESVFAAAKATAIDAEEVGAPPPKLKSNEIISQLQETISELANENDKLRADIDRLTSMGPEAAEIEKLRGTVKRLSDENSTLKSENRSLLTQLRAAEKRVAQLEKELEAFRGLADL